MVSRWILLVALLLGCQSEVVEESLKPHYLFLRCRWASQCDASLKYMHDNMGYTSKFIAGGKDPDGVLTRIYEITRKSSEGSSK